MIRSKQKALNEGLQTMRHNPEPLKALPAPEKSIPNAEILPLMSTILNNGKYNYMICYNIY